FFDKSFIDFQHVEKVPLFRKMMHAQYDNLYFIGLFQPLGCIWPMADYQAMLACAEIVGRYPRPADMEAAIRQEMESPHADFAGGTRHSTEVDYHEFRKELGRELRQAGIDIGRPPRGRWGSRVSVAAPPMRT
ncbi:MAG TPA: monooxygenase, partial [Gammaproteobacteria bacterium]|nr:monooxygenase [Gammaproteobacteria bacterium]